MLTPTRGVAMQIHDQLEKYASPVGVKVTCIFGGRRPEDRLRLGKAFGFSAILSRDRVCISWPFTLTCNCCPWT